MKNFNWKSGSVRIKFVNNSIKLAGSGAQLYDFFLLFPLLDNEICRASDDYRLYCYARRLINFFMSQTIFKKDLENVKKEINLFYGLFFKCFVLPSRKLANKKKHIKFTFKLHHLIHYISLIKKFGPLYQFMTIKFERKHQSLKRIFRSSNCRRKVSYSIMKWVNLTNLNKIHSNREKIKNVILRSEINHKLESMYHSAINLNQNVQELSSALVNGVRYDLYEFYIYQNNQTSLPMFIRVVKILKQESRTKVFGQLYKTLEYDSMNFSYKIKHTRDIVQAENMFCSKKVWCAQKRRIVKDFCLGNEYEHY